MALRTNATDVLAIMDTDLSEREVSPFITPANLIVTSKLSSSGLSDELLTEIEKWLSAHLASCLSRSVGKEKIADMEITYDGFKPGQGLESTIYGSQVLLLDTTGTLGDLGKKRAYLETINADS